MAARGSGRGTGMRGGMDTTRTAHSHLVGFYGTSRNEEERRVENREMRNTNSHWGYRDPTDPYNSSYSLTPNYTLYERLDQMAEIMRSQQEAISKFLKENEGMKSTVDAVKQEIGSLRQELAEIKSDSTPSSSGATPSSHKLDTKLTVST